MNDDTLADTIKPRATVLPFRPKSVTSEVKPALPVVPEVVQLLKDYLKSAEEGRIKFVAIAAVDSDMVAFSTWEPADGGPQLVSASLGAVGFLNHRYNAAADEGAEIDNRLRE